MIPIQIVDGSGTSKKVSVLPEGELLVSVHSSPPLLRQKTKIFGQFLTVDGAPASSNDMGVDGSGTPVEFFIAAQENNDLYLTALSFILGYGTTAQLFEFADSGAALTNGVQIAYTTVGEDEVVITTPTTNYGFLRASLAPMSNDAWQSRGFTVLNDYGYFCTIRLADLIMPNGVKLDRGTKQRFSVTILDDCTDADLFNCRAFGFERLP